MSYITADELSGFRKKFKKLKKITKKVVKAPFKIQKKLITKPIKIAMRVTRPIAKKVIKAPFKFQKKLITQPIKIAYRAVNPPVKKPIKETIKKQEKTYKPVSNNVYRVSFKKRIPLTKNSLVPEIYSEPERDSAPESESAPERDSVQTNYSAPESDSTPENYSAQTSYSSPESNSTFDKEYDMNDLERPMTAQQIKEYYKSNEDAGETINGLSGFKDKLKKLIKKAAVVVATVKGGPVMGKKVYDKLLKSKGSPDEQSAVIQQAGDEAVNAGIPRAVGEHAATTFFSGKNIAIGGSILLGIGLLAFLLMKKRGR